MSSFVLFDSCCYSFSSHRQLVANPLWANLDVAIATITTNFAAFRLLATNYASIDFSYNMHLLILILVMHLLYAAYL